MLNERFLEHWPAEQDVSVDESMIPYYGRHVKTVYTWQTNSFWFQGLVFEQSVGVSDTVRPILRCIGILQLKPWSRASRRFYCDKLDVKVAKRSPFQTIH